MSTRVRSDSAVLGLVVIDTITATSNTNHSRIFTVNSVAVDRGVARCPATGAGRSFMRLSN